MELRKNDVLFEFGHEDGLGVSLTKCQSLDFEKAQPLPSLRHALSRVYTLKSEDCPDPAWWAAKELWFVYLCQSSSIL